MDSNIEGFDWSDPGRKRKCCGECGSFDHTSQRCPNKPCSKCDEIGHIYSTCPIVIALKKEKDRARNLTKNLSSIQVEQRREADLKENMADVQVDRHNS